MLSMIVLAGGRGTRMGAATNKLLLDLAGAPILVRTLERLRSFDGIDEIILVYHREDIDMLRQWNVQERFQLRKLVEGGETRSLSAYAGLAVVDSKAKWVAVHDGARPLLQREDWMRLLAASAKTKAAVLAVPVKDTIKQADSMNHVQATLERERLWSVQTPQLFQRDLLDKAYRNGLVSGQQFTDDASLVEALQETVTLVQGSYSNLKITTPEDLVLAEWLYHQQKVEG